VPEPRAMTARRRASSANSRSSSSTATSSRTISIQWPRRALSRSRGAS
jgi:hypothetical protein